VRRDPGAVTVMAPGPVKTIGKGRFTNGSTAMLVVERFEAGRSASSLVTSLARQGRGSRPPPWRGRSHGPGA
jgi:hypothetical protein